MLLFLQSALSERGCGKNKPYYKLDEVSSAVGVEHKRAWKARGSAWRLEVVHRDTLLPANARPSFERRWEETRKRDAARIRGFEQQIERRLNKSAGSYAKVVEDLGAGVVSGMAMGSGEYFTRIGVGTPAREQYMVIGTGTDVTWIQCMPCSKCYPQQDPIFNPYFSASFSTLSCNSAACSQLGVQGCSRGDRCGYRVDYLDGSYTTGVMATETLTFDDLHICCGHYNTGLFVGAAGLLGLGAGPLSLPSQLGTQLDGVFSYCLGDRYSESSGTLEFGAQSVPQDSFFTPMARNSLLPTFYYLSLAGISIGCKPIQDDVFSIDDTSGRGGVIIDAGTTLTYLQRPAYKAITDAFIAGTPHLTRAQGTSLYETCYDLSDQYDPVIFPAVEFHFSNGETLPLQANNYVVPVDNMGTHCFAFAPTDSGLSIMGNIQQQHIGVSYDSTNSQIGFALDHC
jgi:hypothetical protein